jgi:prepilin-type processing-associated H-X9-DG protein
VVIGIIALLISILMPALAAAREHANRVSCASNLRQIAIAEFAYAAENKGRLTPCFFVTGFTNEAWPAVWSMSVWDEFGARYGLSDGAWTTETVDQMGSPTPYTYPTSKIMLCPSTEMTWSIYYPNPGWGPVFNGSYMYVGNPKYGPSDPLGGAPGYSASYWKDYALVPKKTGDSRSAEKFLAGDLVVAPANGGGAFSTNHKSVENTTDRKTFKGANQLFLDGHVSWKHGDDYPAVFNNVYGPAGNASFIHWPGNPYGLYW